jgi:hypothetical protein
MGGFVTGTGHLGQCVILVFAIVLLAGPRPRCSTRERPLRCSVRAKMTVSVPGLKRGQRRGTTARLHLDLLQWPGQSGDSWAGGRRCLGGRESELSRYQLP